jgi:hypothetical protein
MRKQIIATLAFALAAAGCATGTVLVDGKQVSRVELRFTGSSYSVTHRDAHPQPYGPSSGYDGDGGTIGGDVCGMQIDYGVEHHGDHVQLIGFVDGDHPSAIAIRDEGGARRITGNIGNLGVDLTLTGSHLEGHAGLRVIAMTQADDQLVGFMRLPNVWDEQAGRNAVVKATLDGRDALWRLPPADQAALIPLVLSCHLASSEPGRQLAGDFRGGFGGRAGSAPHGSSALYRTGEIELYGPALHAQLHNEVLPPTK